MTKKKVEKLTLPISDTIPGPGTFEAGIIGDKHSASEIPSVETENAADYIGHGTADDIPSTMQAPKPNKKE
ncbi:MAG: hypothetical protein CVU89_03265 [Firmicutes bacterium HGW-Firmicutes-14]|jgi:hypothetical protein|nr:MAG: hypothetical protein CVU89_03265 [Firmicutes bacterium HGW-Firmicutes-14]